MIEHGTFACMIVDGRSYMRLTCEAIVDAAQLAGRDTDFIWYRHNEQGWEAGGPDAELEAEYQRRMKETLQ